MNIHLLRCTEYSAILAINHGYFFLKNSRKKATQLSNEGVILCVTYMFTADQDAAFVLLCRIK